PVPRSMPTGRGRQWGEGHQALLAALADDAQRRRIESDVRHMEDGKLGPAGTGQIGQRDDGGVAGAGWAATGRTCRRRAPPWCR
ncbi:MAG: hypothetical protein ABIP03_15055, partial [Aquihabitans sp.]